MTTHPRHLIGAAALTLTLLPVAAQAAEPVAAAGFDLTNMAFDAQPLNAGASNGALYWFEPYAAPWLLPSSQPLPEPGGYLYGAQGVDWQSEPNPARLPVSAWPQATLSVSSNTAGTAQLSLTPTTLSGRVSVDAAQFQQMAQIAADTGGYDVGAGINMDTLQPWRVVLAPHTQLTWSGTITQFVSQNTQALNDLLTPFYRPDLTMDVMVRSYFGLSFNPDEGLIYGDQPAEANSYLDGGLGTYAPDYVTDIPEFQSEPGKTFSITLTNPTDQPLGAGYYFQLQTGVATTIQASWVPDPVVPSVPEPATYALMGLGLVGLAAVTRRRHAQA
ncbi:MAG: hypothetical protein RI907_2655 [Pseudomonadota bacterium]|jgi:hypothetical protein